MSDLDAIAIRVNRDGKWLSVFPNELPYMTPTELEDMANQQVAQAIKTAIDADPQWRYHPYHDLYVNDRLWRE